MRWLRRAREYVGEQRRRGNLDEGCLLCGDFGRAASRTRSSSARVSIRRVRVASCSYCAASWSKPGSFCLPQFLSEGPGSFRCVDTISLVCDLIEDGVEVGDLVVPQPAHPDELGSGTTGRGDRGDALPAGGQLSGRRVAVVIPRSWACCLELCRAAKSQCSAVASATASWMQRRWN